MNYVGTRSCGCVLVAQLCTREADVAKFLYRCKSDGLIAEQRSDEWIRENFGWCKLHKPNEETKQTTLF